MIFVRGNFFEFCLFLCFRFRLPARLIKAFPIVTISCFAKSELIVGDRHRERGMYGVVFVNSLIAKAGAELANIISRFHDRV